MMSHYEQLLLLSVLVNCISLVFLLQAKFSKSEPLGLVFFYKLQHPDTEGKKCQEWYSAKAA